MKYLELIKGKPGNNPLNIKYYEFFKSFNLCFIEIFEHSILIKSEQNIIFTSKIEKITGDRSNYFEIYQGGFDDGCNFLLYKQTDFIRDFLLKQGVNESIAFVSSEYEYSIYFNIVDSNERERFFSNPNENNISSETVVELPENKSYVNGTKLIYYDFREPSFIEYIKQIDYESNLMEGYITMMYFHDFDDLKEFLIYLYEEAQYLIDQDDFYSLYNYWEMSSQYKFPEEAIKDTMRLEYIYNYAIQTEDIEALDELLLECNNGDDVYSLWKRIKYQLRKLRSNL